MGLKGESRAERWRVPGRQEQEGQGQTQASEGLRGVGGEQAAQGRPPTNQQGASRFLRAERRLCCGEEWSSLPSHGQSACWKKQAQRAICKAGWESITSPPPQSDLKRKTKGLLCQDGKGGTLSRLALRKAKCIASRPHASSTDFPSQLPPPPMRPAKPVS